MANAVQADETRAYTENLITLGHWSDQLAQLAIASIEWDVPETVDPIYIERSLFYHGRVIFFAVEEGLVALSGFGSSLPNVYGIPTRRIVHGANGFTAELDNTNSVICYNNVTRTNGSDRALMYSKRLALLDRIIELNAKAQKRPVIIKAPKEAELSVENAYSEYDANADVIRITNDFDPQAIAVLNMAVPFEGNALRALQRDIYAQYLQERGIGSANTGKAERLNTSEVAAGNSGLLIFQQSLLAPRVQACKLINQRFESVLGGKQVSCRFRRDMIDYILDDLQAGIDSKKTPAAGGFTYEEREADNNG